MRSVLSLCLFFVSMLVGRALALDITVGGDVGTVNASQFLTVSGADAVFLNDCSSECTPAMNAISACGDSDACLCDSATVTNITACEQCMFADVIAKNARPSDPRTGSTPALAAYVAACAAEGITVSASETTLVVPPDWDGPLGMGLSVVGTAFTLMAGLALGTSGIYILNTM